MTPKTSLQTFYRRRTATDRPLKASTCRLYRERLRLYSKCLEREALLSDLTAAKFASFLAWLDGQELTRSSRTKCRWIVRQVWELAYRDGLVKDRPPAALRPRRGGRAPEEPPALPNPTTDHEPQGNGEWAWQPVADMLVGAWAGSGDVIAAKPGEKTLSMLVDQYLVNTHLKASSAAWYRRIAEVLRDFYGTDPPVAALTEETLNHFLADKTLAKRSVYYVRSLRCGLLAILGPLVDPRRVRRVKLTKLRPATWSHGEVASLVRAAVVLPEYKRAYYQKIIAFAFHTGLSQSDLHELTRRDVSQDGTVIFHRGKTDSDVAAWVPPELLEGLPVIGRLFPRHWSNEQFRRDFARIVAAAGLSGTFKKLRKTSGTQAELLTGKGHEHLANSRRVFESHYLDRRLVHREPIRLPAVSSGS